MSRKFNKKFFLFIGSITGFIILPIVSTSCKTTNTQTDIDTKKGDDVDDEDTNNDDSSTPNPSDDDQTKDNDSQDDQSNEPTVVLGNPEFNLGQFTYYNEYVDEIFSSLNVVLNTNSDGEIIAPTKNGDTYTFDNVKVSSVIWTSSKWWDYYQIEDLYDDNATVSFTLSNTETSPSNLEIYFNYSSDILHYKDEDENDINSCLVTLVEGFSYNKDNYEISIDNLSSSSQIELVGTPITTIIYLDLNYSALNSSTNVKASLKSNYLNAVVNSTTIKANFLNIKKNYISNVSSSVYLKSSDVASLTVDSSKGLSFSLSIAAVLNNGSWYVDTSKSKPFTGVLTFQQNAFLTDDYNWVFSVTQEGSVTINYDGTTSTITTSDDFSARLFNYTYYNRNNETEFTISQNSSSNAFTWVDGSVPTSWEIDISENGSTSYPYTFTLTGNKTSFAFDVNSII